MLSKIDVMATPEDLEQAEAIDEELEKMADRFFMENPSYANNNIEAEETEEVIFDPNTGGVFKEKEENENKKEVIEYVNPETSLIEEAFLRELIIKETKKINESSNKAMAHTENSEISPSLKEKLVSEYTETARAEANLYRNLLLQKNFLKNDIINKDIESHLKAETFKFFADLFRLTEKVNIETVEYYTNIIEELVEQVDYLTDKLEELEKKENENV